MTKYSIALRICCLSLFLQSCSGGDGGSTVTPPTASVPTFSSPELLATLPVRYQVVVGQIAVDSAGGLTIPWSGLAALTELAPRAGFVHIDSNGAVTGTESPDHELPLLGWSFDAKGPSTLLTGGTSGGAGVLRTWQRSTTGEWQGTSLPIGTVLIQGHSFAAREGEPAFATVSLVRVDAVPVYEIGVAEGSAEKPWKTPVVLANQDSDGALAVAADGHALLVGSRAWHLYTPSKGWGSTNSLPFADGSSAFLRPGKLMADTAGRFHLAAEICPLPFEMARCHPVAVIFDPASGWRTPEEIEPSGPGSAVHDIYATPGGSAVFWAWRGNGSSESSAAEMWAAVRRPDLGWSGPIVLAPMADGFFPTASFAGDNGGRIFGAWNDGLGKVTYAVYTPSAGWSTPTVLHQTPFTIGEAHGNIRALTDARDVPTLVWAMPLGDGRTGIYRSQLK